MTHEKDAPIEIRNLIRAWNRELDDSEGEKGRRGKGKKGKREKGEKGRRGKGKKGKREKGPCVRQ